MFVPIAICYIEKENIFAKVAGYILLLMAVAFKIAIPGFSWVVGYIDAQGGSSGSCHQWATI